MLTLRWPVVLVTLLLRRAHFCLLRNIDPLGALVVERIDFVNLCKHQRKT